MGLCSGIIIGKGEQGSRLGSAALVAKDQKAKNWTKG